MQQLTLVKNGVRSSENWAKIEVGQIISDDAVELNGGARLIMFLLDLMPFFVH